LATADRKRIATVDIWSKEKLDLLRCYIGNFSGPGGFLTATKAAQQRYYIDLFAGPGQNSVKGTDLVISGSPLIALEAGPPTFTHLFWVDTNGRNVASLRAHRAEHPEHQIEIFHGNANVQVDKVLKIIPRTYPTFAFLDPRGAELSWKTIEKLARHKPDRKIELFILFAYNQGLVRLMPNDASKMVNEAALDRVMPDPDGWRRIYKTRIDRVSRPRDFRLSVLEEYVRGLKSLGYKFVPSPRLITTQERRPLYFMVFASDHPVGNSIMSWRLKNIRQNPIQTSFIPYEQQY
jgi:three-Cys-motif partner protein